MPNNGGNPFLVRLETTPLVHGPLERVALSTTVPEYDIDHSVQLRMKQLAKPDGESSDSITYRSWTSSGVRTTKQRRFTVMLVNNVPRFVSKVSLDPTDDKVVREGIILAQLSLPASLRCPHLAAFIEGGFIMSYLPTMDLPNVLTEHTSAKLTSLVDRTISIMADMHVRNATTEPGLNLRRHAVGKYVDNPYTDEKRFRTALSKALIGPTHGDLAPWNIRYDPDSDDIGVLDWEDYQSFGVPAVDIINLLLTLGLVVFPSFQQNGFDWLFQQVLNSSHWYALFLRDAIRNYAHLTSQEPRLVIDLLPLFCQWLSARIEREGRDTRGLYYGRFFTLYTQDPPTWADDL
jgi:hypothetical protein